MVKMLVLERGDLPLFFPPDLNYDVKRTFFYYYNCLYSSSVLSSSVLSVLKRDMGESTVLAAAPVEIFYTASPERPRIPKKLKEREHGTVTSRDFRATGLLLRSPYHSSSAQNWAGLND